MVFWSMVASFGFRCLGRAAGRAGRAGRAAGRADRLGRAGRPSCRRSFLAAPLVNPFRGFRRGAIVQ
jgi:hypothetical protein